MSRKVTILKAIRSLKADLMKNRVNLHKSLPLCSSLCGMWPKLKSESARLFHLASPTIFPAIKIRQLLISHRAYIRWCLMVRGFYLSAKVKLKSEDATNWNSNHVVTSHVDVGHEGLPPTSHSDPFDSKFQLLCNGRTFDRKINNRHDFYGSHFSTFKLSNVLLFSLRVLSWY